MTNRDKLDAAIDDILGKRPRRNSTPGASRANTSGAPNHSSASRFQKAARIALRTPEVMVKVTHGARGNRHVREHFNYITRNGKLAAETDKGEIVEGKAAVQALAGDWLQTDNGKRRRNSRDTLNLVLSMPPGTDRDRLQDAVRKFAARNFAADRQYLFVRHDDTEHPHCHLTLKAVGYDGRRLNPRKADLQAWRESFALCLREQGVAAEASPRRARCKTRKGKRQAVVHAEKRGASTVAKAKAREAIQQALQQKPVSQPWDAAIARRYRQVQAGWHHAANALAAADTTDTKQLAAAMQHFRQTMPPRRTERQALMERAREHLARRQQEATSRSAARTKPDPEHDR